MTDKELLAKNVFGELTLEDVYRRFGKNLVAIQVENSLGADLVNTSWSIDDGQFLGHGEYEVDFVFNLKSKVKVFDSHIELKDEEGTEWYLTFLVPAKLSRIIPGGKK